MYKNILNTNKKNVPLRLSQELYDYVNKKDENFYMEMFYYDNGKILSETKDLRLLEKKGGVIILPAPINSDRMDKNELSKYLIKNLDLINDYLFKQKNIDYILQRDTIVGCSIGNFFNGRYYSRNGQLYSNESITIELVDLDFDEVVAIAENLCKQMKQNSVLVRDNSQFNMIYIEAKDINLKEINNK